VTAYKILRGTQQFGPYSRSDVERYLADGRLVTADLAWVEEQQRWMPLSELRAQQAPPSHPDRNPARIFVGLQYPYYEVKWAALESRASSYSWNWAAFCWGPFWMAYRKMYATVWAYFGIICIFEMISHFIKGVAPVSWAVSFVVGWHGNSWYKHHVQRKLAEIQRIATPQTADLELMRQGGTSIGAVIGFGLVLLFIAVVSAAIEDPSLFK
jgi:hypothetical protein